MAAEGCSYTLLAALVRLGVAKFARDLGFAADLYGVLEQEAHKLLGSSPGFHELARAMRRNWPRGSDNFAELVQLLELDLDSAFALALAGEVESSYALGVMLSELQAPGSARPAVHFMGSLLDDLFRGTVITGENIHAHILVENRVLQLEGRGPTPLCDVCVNPWLWAVLRGVDARWPGCRLVHHPRAALVPRETRQQVSRLQEVLASGESALVIRGMPGSGRHLAAAYVARRLGLKALSVPVDTWLAEPALDIACRVAGWMPLLSPGLGPGERWFLRSPVVPLPVGVVLGTDGSIDGADCIEMELGLPGESQRFGLWHRRLGDEPLARELAAGTLMSAPAIDRVASTALMISRQQGAAVTHEHVLRARYSIGGDRLRLLAQPVENQVTAEALVLPERVGAGIADMTARARRRDTLGRNLGVTLQAAPSRGVRALFVGESGTGKTLAASLVANSISAPLYRVDSAAVMNKYIGESEKNLAALLDDAAAQDVVLLFDEAEATFARRGEGKGRDAGQHFSDMLSNFLLTRIENHPGIVILTTNNREKIDPAFTRRLDYVIEFPLPDFEARRELWDKHLGRRSPHRDISGWLASHCDLPGGNIRNVVLNAATRQADSRTVISSDALIECAREEYHKLGRTSPPQLHRFQGDK